LGLLIQEKVLIYLRQWQFVKRLLFANKYTHPVNRVKPVCFASLVVMQFKQGTNRHQTCFITLDQQVSTNNPVRLIDYLAKAGDN